jgi:hypothetical protein
MGVQAKSLRADLRENGVIPSGGVAARDFIRYQAPAALKARLMVFAERWLSG